jgi:tetratricopeptide (TPR) repeat protein
MSEVQIFLSIVALGIFILYFKQLFSGDFPKRGVDYEAKAQESIQEPKRRDILNPANSKEAKVDRVEKLLKIADESIQKGDYQEASKALLSLLILEPNHLDGNRMLAVVHLNKGELKEAKETLIKILKRNPEDDLSYTLLANTLNKLGEREEAIKYHKKAIDLDPYYARHYFDYANTLLELGDKSKALKVYKGALELEPNMVEAKEAIEKLTKTKEA